MIISFEELPDIRTRHQNEKIVLGGGTFDLFHVNHLEYLDQLKKLGDIVVVYVNNDARVRRDKGAMRPIIPDSDRVRIVDSLKGVTYACIFPGVRPRRGRDPFYAEMFSKLQPDAFASSNDAWNRGKDIMQRAVYTFLPRAEVGGHTSTTEIINHIVAKHSG